RRPCGTRILAAEWWGSDRSAPADRRQGPQSADPVCPRPGQINDPELSRTFDPLSRRAGAAMGTAFFRLPAPRAHYCASGGGVIEAASPYAAQRRAAAPGVSAWVSASAGTGKTKVLTDRLLGLMLEGSDPARVLCLTFTRA